MVERGLGDPEKSFFRTQIAKQMRSPQFSDDHFTSTYQPGYAHVVLKMPLPGIEPQERDSYSAMVSTPSMLPDGYIVTEKVLELTDDIFSYRETNHVYDKNNRLMPEKSKIIPADSNDLQNGYNDVLEFITALKPEDEVNG